MSANTFGTFLDTIKSLESVPAASKKTSESELLVIAKALMSQNGEAPLPLVMQKVGIPQDAFLGAFVQGREKGLFEVDDNPDVPVLKLTKLGRSLAG